MPSSCTKNVQTMCGACMLTNMGSSKNLFSAFFTEQYHILIALYSLLH